MYQPSALILSIQTVPDCNRKVKESSVTT